MEYKEVEVNEAYEGLSPEQVYEEPQVDYSVEIPIDGNMPPEPENPEPLQSTQSIKEQVNPNEDIVELNTLEMSQNFQITGITYD